MRAAGCLLPIHMSVDVPHMTDVLDHCSEPLRRLNVDQLAGEPGGLEGDEVSPLSRQGPMLGRQSL